MRVEYLIGSSAAALAAFATCPAGAQTVAQPGTDAAAAAAQPEAAATAAQPAGGSPAADAADTRSQPADTNGEILVTARRRAERLRDVPVAITALSGEALQVRNVSQVVDLTVTVPNLSYTTASVPQLVIRGVGSGTNEGFDQSAAKFINNVYFGVSHDAKIPIFDIERLEVLKGPQVIAFGNSATAGALSFTTTRPGNVFAVNGNAGYDFVSNESKVQGGVTTPLGEDASFRLAGIFQRLGRGQTYNALTDRRELQQRSWGVRPTLRLTPTSTLEVILMGEYDYSLSTGYPNQAIRQPLSPAGLRYPEVDRVDRNDISYDRAPIFSDAMYKQRGGVVTGDVIFDVLGGSISSTTAYRRQRTLVQQGLPGPNYDLTFFQHVMLTYRQFSQELRFNGSYGPLDIFTGGYYERSTRNVTAASAYFLAGVGATGNAAIPTHRLILYDQKYDKLSAVIDATLRLGGGFSVSAGLRYSDYAKDAGQEAFGAEIAPGLNFGTRRSYFRSFSTPASNARLAATPAFGAQPHLFPMGTLRLRDHHWQPQVLAQYKFGENMAYAKYVKGDKVGGFDTNFGGTNPAGAAFDKEAADMYEVGLKGVTPDRTFDYTVAIFRETFTGLQQSFLNGVTNAFVVTNAGKARSQGIEVEAALRPVAGLRLSVNGSYLDAEFADYPNAPCNTLQVAERGGAGCRQDRTGTPLQLASKWNGTVAVDYSRPVGESLLGGGVSVYARSKFNAGAVNDPGAVQSGFAMVDGHLDFSPGNANWKLSLFARNLTNKRYLSYVVAPPGNATALISSFERGRQLGMMVDFRY